jgi:hypothetical protein
VDRKRRLWIEFEVSRADPVANQVKFATAHLFAPQPETDSFVSMISPHVVWGRRNLAANTVLLMRHLGMRAFQTVLLPHLEPARIKQLNHLPLVALSTEGLPVAAELERALFISEEVARVRERRIYPAGDLLDVLLNVRGWNSTVETSSCATLWGRRTVTYFVFDPYSKSFAPSKFCAFVVPPLTGPVESACWPSGAGTGMTIEIYATLQETPGFDGARAWSHLTRRLAMRVCLPSEIPEVWAHFERWLECHSQRIQIHPSGPKLLVPPAWFR